MNPFVSSSRPVHSNENLASPQPAIERELFNEHGPLQAPVHALRRALTTRAGWLGLCAAVGIACLLLVFRPFWQSHFNLILSDQVDGRFYIAILEHWTRVFRGQARMSSPNFFYPEQGVLGYSDALFLLALPFALLRSVAVDRYLAFEFTMMLSGALSFASFLYLLRRNLRFARLTALLGACLFTIFNTYFMHFVHAQLAAVAFVPSLIILAATFWELRDSQPFRAQLCISACASLLALVLFTSFYIGWFTILFAGTAILTGLTLMVVSKRSFECVRRVGTEVWRQRLAFALALLSFGISLVPFLMVYIPALRHTGKRSFVECLYFLQPPLAVFDTGPANLLWGTLSGRIEHHNFPHGIPEHPSGWPIVTLVLFLLSAAYAMSSFLRVGRKSDLKSDSSSSLPLAAVAVTCVLLALLGMRFGMHAPFWKIVWNLVPGAAAIRVPQRINLVISVGVLIVCMFGFEELCRRLSRKSVGAWLVVAALSTLLVAEQVNFMPTHLISRKAEFAKLAHIGPPPPDCREFYIASARKERFAILAAQTDAMLVAEQFNLATINGYSGWFPTGWPFLLPASAATNAERALEWARDHDLKMGLCSLDLSSDTWSTVAIEGSNESAYLIKQPVANPSFEASSLVPWDRFGPVIAEVSSEKSHSGNHSLAEKSGTGSVYEDINGLEPGRTYIVSAWVCAGPNSTAEGMIAVFEPSTRTAIYSNPHLPGPDWQRVSESITAGKLGTIRIHLFRKQGSGAIYWDDVTVYREQ